MSTQKIEIPEDFLESVKSGKSMDELASQYFVSKATISRWKKKLGVVNKALEIDVDMFKRMKQLGLYDREIAYILGCSHRTIQDYKSENGLIDNNFGRKRRYGND